MLERIVGALVRALLVGLMVTLPASLLPDLQPDAAQLVVLVAIFGALLTFIEYSARYPGLVEFRHAPPFNRIRFLSLGVTVLCLSLMMRGQLAPTSGTEFVTALGGMIGQWLDVPFSPLRLLLLTLPVSATPAEVAMLRAAAGLSAGLAVLTLGIFALAIWHRRWPGQHAGFNLWMNLPSFEPGAGADAVARLERDGRSNVLLGVLLPFVTPALMLAAGSVLTPLSQAGAQTQIWVIAAWAFLPACLLMRGMALNRIARMIRARREEAAAGAALQAV